MILLVARRAAVSPDQIATQVFRIPFPRATHLSRRTTTYRLFGDSPEAEP